MSSASGRFRKADRLRRSVEFQRVTRHGRRAAGTAFVVLLSEREQEAGAFRGSRLGVTVSRKVGGAVVRNRVKRRIREWFRVRRESLGEGRDWVVIGRAAAAGLEHGAADRELSRLCRMAAGSDARGGAT